MQFAEFWSNQLVKSTHNLVEQALSKISLQHYRTQLTKDHNVQLNMQCIAATRKTFLIHT